MTRPITDKDGKPIPGAVMDAHSPPGAQIRLRPLECGYVEITTQVARGTFPLTVVLTRAQLDILIEDGLNE